MRTPSTDLHYCTPTTTPAVNSQHRPASPAKTELTGCFTDVLVDFSSANWSGPDLARSSPGWPDMRLSVRTRFGRESLDRRRQIRNLVGEICPPCASSWPDLAPSQSRQARSSRPKRTFFFWLLSLHFGNSIGNSI